MKRSEINRLVQAARECFAHHGQTLPPRPRWDVTDFGLGDWRRHGLVLVNLAEEPEYCEKLMYAQRGMTTPAHCHRRKKEDIIARHGTLRVTVWAAPPAEAAGLPLTLKVNGEPRALVSGADLDLPAGSRVTLTPGVYHEFAPLTEECVIGEVSTANDDTRDNFFINPDVGRYPAIEEDEPPLVTLLSEHNQAGGADRDA
ncbi:MAG: D-lyxose/D-mannose family sugar isomerase [Verrucomicrobiales bacterium]|jgi:D-lyxose ketol-isomerase|nr:D-lyxose/D-mannose family sugar isomerase [Verrucomicrobiales bacterium]